MTEQEIFERLKEALNYDYLTEQFDCAEVTNLEDYLQNIKNERELEKAYDAEAFDRHNTYQEFIHYLNGGSLGDTKYIIEAFDNNTYNKFKGYVKVEKLVKDNKLYLKFEVDGTKLTAEWQPSDNYGVYQTCGNLGDDYSGYLLFPTYIDDEYFCLEYSC